MSAVVAAVQLKLQAAIGQIPSCPPAGCAQKDIDEAFRFVYESIGDERNFKCPVERNPKRANQKKADHKKCDDLALSLFDTAPHARAFFKGLVEDFGAKIKETVGTHLAKGSVVKADGLASPLREDGHFNLFAAAGSTIEQRFAVLEAL